MADLKLKCNCGKVAGIAHNIKPGYGNRLICYCKDCQAFAKHLKRDADTLDSYGGTDILQLPPSLIEIQQGFENISCLRLSNKGLYRWFTACCNTPIGNTVGLNLPLIGVIHTFIQSDQNIDAKIGPVAGSVYTEHAVSELPLKLNHSQSKLGIILRVLRKILIWKITGKGNPNPFFDRTGKPVVKPCVVESQS